MLDTIMELAGNEKLVATVVLGIIALAVILPQYIRGRQAQPEKKRMRRKTKAEVTKTESSHYLRDEGEIWVNYVFTVDGKEYAYKKVWIAPTMHGKYYGGGMIPTPEQDRSSDKLSLMLFHGAGRLRALSVFPSIFKGKHVKHKNMVAVHTGHEITVEFDRPTPLQIDGETILGVTEYSVKAKVLAEIS